ncbi:phosphopantetheine-binding protein, partial [Pseudomonas fluorescens]
MSVAVKESVTKYLEEALGRPVDIHQYSDDTTLNALGLDSLLTVGVLVSLLEDSSVDIGEYADSLVAPSTLGDLFDIANRFMSDGKPTSDGGEMSRERRSQLEFY